MPGLKNTVESAALLATRAKLEATASADERPQPAGECARRHFLDGRAEGERCAGDRPGRAAATAGSRRLDQAARRRSALARIETQARDPPATTWAIGPRPATGLSGCSRSRRPASSRSSSRWPAPAPRRSNSAPAATSCASIPRHGRLQEIPNHRSRPARTRRRQDLAERQAGKGKLETCQPEDNQVGATEMMYRSKSLGFPGARWTVLSSPSPHPSPLPRGEGVSHPA